MGLCYVKPLAILNLEPGKEIVLTDQDLVHSFICCSNSFLPLEELVEFQVVEREKETINAELSYFVMHV